MIEWLSGLARARLRFDLMVERYSAWLPIGLAAIVLAALALGAASNATRARVEAQRDSVAQLRTGAHASANKAEPVDATRVTSPVWDVLPSAQRRNDDLKSLFQMARRRGLLVAQADYGWPADGAATIDGLQVTLPLNGTYPQLRQFAEDALRAMPHLSIDQIGFERDAIANSTVTARIKLTLWYQADAASPRVGAAPRVTALEPKT